MCRISSKSSQMHFFLVLCLSVMFSATDCTYRRRTDQRLKVLENGIALLKSEFSLWQMEYMNFIDNITLRNEKIAENLDHKTDKADDDHEVFGERTFEQALKFAFKTEKEHRYTFEKRMQADLQSAQIDIKHMIEKDVLIKLRNLERKIDEIQDYQNGERQRNNNNDIAVSDLKDEISSLKTSVLSLEETAKENVKTIQNKMQKENEDTKFLLSGLQDQIKNTQVSFSAELGKSIYDLNPGSTIVFDRVLNNIGNAFSPITGAFTAPRDGVYVFFTHIMGGPRAMEIYLKKNISGVMWLYSSGSVYGRDANMVVLSLTKGDKITVAKYGNFGQPPFYVHHVWTTFSGFMLFAT